MRVDADRIELLIQRARQGESNSRDELFEASMPMLLFWSQSYDKLLLRLRLSMRDLCQDVLLIVQKNFELFKGITASSWFAWLKKIHHRLLANLIRKKANHVQLNQSELVHDPESANTDLFVSRDSTPGTMAMVKEQSERVRTILGLMDKSHRHALNTWMDGMSLEEHAMLLNTKIHTVRYLRFKALREFNTLWKNLGTAS